MHSIRLKITTVTVAAILTSILALGSIALLTLNMESNRSSAETMGLVSENMQHRLDAYLMSVQQSVDMAIHMADDSLRGLDMNLLGGNNSPEDAERLDTILRAHCAEVEHAFSSIASSTNGIITYFYCINGELKSAEQGFLWSKLDQGSFIRQTPPLSADLDINDSEHTVWYYAPLKAGRATWVGPYRAHYLGELLTISYVAPIYSHGFLIGVLGMDIPFHTLVEQVEALPVYDTGFAFLMDKDGRILYHPELESGVTPDTEGLNSTEIFKFRSSGDTLIRYTRNGVKRQLAFSTLINNIKVGVTAPVSEISATRRQLTAVLLVVAAVILAVFLTVSLLLMGAVTKPLLKLTAASEELRAGNYNVELDYEGNDEVGVLTDTFRQMRDEMKLHIRDLNSRAYTDAMTGVKNKGAFTGFLSRIDEEIAAPDASPAFSIVIFDCNGLKQINDKYGHSQGDIFLKVSCRLICKAFAHCPVFRLGGDEFAALLQDANHEKRNELLTGFDALVAEHNAAAANPWERVSLSRGMASYRPGTDRSAEQVLQRADTRMYNDKRRTKAGLK